MGKRVLSLGLGWFAVQATWTTYNAFMPLFYKALTAAPDPVTGKLIPNLFLVGFLMTTDNILALLQPFWGARSDVTRTRFGRRLPYIFVGMPMAAVFTLILPLFSNVSLIALIGAALLMNSSMTVFRAPLVALFSDLFPRRVRTQVSGTTNLFAGMGAIVALLAGGKLFDINPIYPCRSAPASPDDAVHRALPSVGEEKPGNRRCGDPGSVPAPEGPLGASPRRIAAVAHAYDNAQPG
jgi:maltose/moltooligosaccharide transporter